MAGLRFLTVEQVLNLHATALERSGGLAGLRDRGLLEAAIAMPMAQFSGEFVHPDLAAMAAAYLFHITQAHAFVDGNKRTACLATLVFLDANGADLHISPRAIEEVVVSVAAGQTSKAELTLWFQRQRGR